ncbi:MAG: isopeptide-forming domain-containing fimbrial protein [Erysipelotrichaceae bacterium]|nr:isopeptide-forming domain-containing fimbrial protein [Erysipelotrichaceae bacterium]
MKHLKRHLSLALSALILTGMQTAVFAEGEGQQTTGTYTITVTNDNPAISIAGKTYTAYKLFDVVYSGTNYAYTINTGNPFYTSAKSVLDEYFDFGDIASETDVKNVTVKTGKMDPETNTLSASDVRALADSLKPYISGTGAGSAAAQGETAVITVPEAGYYIITGTVKPTDPENSDSEVISAVILSNADPDAEIQPKAGVPTLSKKITSVKEGTAEITGAILDSQGLAASAKVGSVVSFELDSIVPDLTGYSTYTFTVTDTLSAGLTYSGNFKMMINGAEVTAAPEVSGQTLTVTIPFATLSNYTKGDPIRITYDAAVNQNALTANYENNTAVLTYSNSPYSEGTGETPAKTVYITDIDLDVLKIDGSDHSKSLSGAEFKLYRTVEGGNEYYLWDTDHQAISWVSDRNSGDTFKTDSSGHFEQVIRGLGQGTYYLLETKAPVGYNLLKDPVTVVITASETDQLITYDVTFSGESASLTNHSIDMNTVRGNGQPKAVGSIENNSGIILPDTGGTGTKLFYLTGSILLFLAAILNISKKNTRVQ